MLDHLARGRFDVDPWVIAGEGFTHAGKTYAYFGILPALLRLPLMVLPGWRSVDVTLVSCVLGTAVAGYFKLCAIVAVIRRLDATRRRDLIFVALVVSLLFGGSQVQFAKASIYIEVICWANAFGAAFVYCAVEGLLAGFSRLRLVVMAVLAGLTLLTRVSTALGLYVALALLLPWLAWSKAAGLRRWRALFSNRVIAPATILAGFVFACGVVNFKRWGSPLIFANLTENVIYRYLYPERIPIINQYGDFNLVRIGYGLMYYFLPLWAIIGPNQQFWFANFQRRTIDSVEMPPSSFLLTDPVLILLSAICLWLLLSRRMPKGFDRASCGLILAGLAVPALIILMYETMALRYRAEFYPFLTTAALLGSYAACAPQGWVPPRWLGGTVAASAAVGVIATHLIMALYWLSPAGPADHLPDLLRHGWAAFYRSQLGMKLHQRWWF
jgi:hypothetical protein